MIKVLLFGAAGHMGKFVAEAVKKTDDLVIAAGVDKSPEKAEFPIYDSAEKVMEKVDVIIEFSFHGAVASILDYAVKNSVPAVLCTTGYTESEAAAIKEASKKTAIFQSANMSVGINLISLLCKLAEETLQNYDVEIIEKHHNRKLDAPSGTALMLAKAVQSANPELFVNLSRMDEKKPRDKKEIGISSVRGGNIVGEHEVCFIGDNEIITVKHEAVSRAVFADGAVNAARFLVGKSPKIYDMNDMLN